MLHVALESLKNFGTLHVVYKYKKNCLVCLKYCPPNFLTRNRSFTQISQLTLLTSSSDTWYLSVTSVILKKYINQNVSTHESIRSKHSGRESDLSGKKCSKQGTINQYNYKKYILWYDTTDIYIVLGNIHSLLFFGEF